MKRQGILLKPFIIIIIIIITIIFYRILKEQLQSNKRKKLKWKRLIKMMKKS